MNYDEEIIKWHGKDKVPEEELSSCCDSEMLPSGQCLTCGADGLKKQNHA